MLEEEGIDQTTHEKIFIGKLSEVDHNEVQRYVSVLEKNLNNVEKLKKCLKWAVPTYQPKKAQPPDEKPYRKEPEPEKQQVKMKIGMRRAAT